MRILKSMKLKKVIAYLVIVICIFSFICIVSACEDTNSKEQMEDIKAKNEQLECERLINNYKSICRTRLQECLLNTFENASPRSIS